MVWRTVGTVDELLGALRDGAQKIELTTTLSGLGSFTLPPGVSLRGGGLEFGAKGLQLSSNNTVENLSVTVPDTRSRSTTTYRSQDLGTLTLRGITTRGQVYLQASSNVRSGTVHAKDIHVTAADTRDRLDGPRASGSRPCRAPSRSGTGSPTPPWCCMPGWKTFRRAAPGNRSAAAGCSWAATWMARAMPTAGPSPWRCSAPARCIPTAASPREPPDLISGGVFVISGAEVDEVQNLGSTTTYGPNDMVLDNWGSVQRWNATAPVTSHGPSGIGFVNFGDLGTLNVSAAIETHGLGARGFNVYDGSLQSASFKSITTYGDGAVGVQVSRELPELTIAQGIMTKGGTGQSLVKGVLVDLSAIALSVKPTGHVGRISIGGDISTEGAGVVAVELEGGVDVMDVGGQIEALGAGADGIRLSAQNADRLVLPVIKAEHGTGQGGHSVGAAAGQKTVARAISMDRARATAFGCRVETRSRPGVRRLRRWARRNPIRRFPGPGRCTAARWQRRRRRGARPPRGPRPCPLRAGSRRRRRRPR